MRNAEGNSPPESSPLASLPSQDHAHINSGSSSSSIIDYRLEPDNQSKVIEDPKIAAVPDVSDGLEVKEVITGYSEVYDIPAPHSLRTSTPHLSDNPQQPEDGGSVTIDNVRVNDMMLSNASNEVKSYENNHYNGVRSDELSQHQIEATSIPDKAPEPTDPSKYEKQVDIDTGLVDTAAPIESVKEVVTKFGGIVDWKAHKIQSAERRKHVECELEKAQQEIPEYKKQSETVEDAKSQVLKELDSKKRLVEELKLNLERAQTEEHQAKQDSELAKLRLEEMEQGIANEASVAAKRQLEVAKARQAAAIKELKSVKDELEKLRVDHSSLVAEKDVTVKRAKEAVSASKEVEETVEELTLKLIATKESLESAHAAHLEAEEQRIGAAMAREQNSLNWEEELKQAEEELQKLDQKLLSTKDLKLKLDTASALLLDLKTELAAYLEAKLNQEIGEEEGNFKGGLEEPKKKTHMNLQAAVDLAKKELEEVKLNIEMATAEVNCLKVAAMSLKSEFERENLGLATMKQREGMASVAVASLEAELNRTTSEVDLLHLKEKEAREKMVELPKQLEQSAQEAAQARSLAHLAREELWKAKEEVEQVKGGVSTTECSLQAAQKEIEAARASERLALAAVKALQESELAASTGGEDAPSGVTLSLEEYYMLSKQAHEAEEQASMKVDAAISQIEVAKGSELRSLEKLEEVNRETVATKQAFRIAMEKAKKAKEGKLGAEQELRKWRAEHKQRRKANDADQGVVNSTRSSERSSEEIKEPKSFDKEATGPVQPVSSPNVYIPENSTEPDSSPEVKVGKKKKKFSLYPRIVMLLGRRKSETSNTV